MPTYHLKLPKAVRSLWNIRLLPSMCLGIIKLQFKTPSHSPLLFRSLSICLLSQNHDISSIHYQVSLRLTGVNINESNLKIFFRATDFQQALKFYTCTSSVVHPSRSAHWRINLFLLSFKGISANLFTFSFLPLSHWGLFSLDNSAIMPFASGQWANKSS